jgi:hypothetical protein
VRPRRPRAGPRPCPRGLRVPGHLRPHHHAPPGVGRRGQLDQWGRRANRGWATANRRQWGRVDERRRATSRSAGRSWCIGERKEERGGGGGQPAMAEEGADGSLGKERREGRRNPSWYHVLGNDFLCYSSNPREGGYIELAIHGPLWAVQGHMGHSPYIH